MIGHTREDLAHEADDTCFTCFEEPNEEGKCKCQRYLEDGDLTDE